jgi:hypothetical protein
MKGAARDTNEASPTPTKALDNIKISKFGAAAQPKQARVHTPMPRARSLKSEVREKIVKCGK